MPISSSKLKIYDYINKFFDYINRNSSVLIFTPWLDSIGNCAEDIYYSLLKARRLGKKAVFLYPQDLFWKFRFGISNSELFNLESDYNISNKVFPWYLIKALLTFIFWPMRTLYLLKRKCLIEIYGWEKVCNWPDFFWYKIPSIGRGNLWKPEDIEYFSKNIVKSMKWEEQFNEYLSVRIPQDKFKYAEKLRVKMGIPLDKWFVCLHVREGGFRKDTNFYPWRNSFIFNYIKAIKLITDRGGIVVRMGDDTMIPLPAMERVIDYPHTSFKSELMDLYLISQCKFYIGVNSGILDVARLFQKPLVITNLTDWALGYSLLKGSLSIIKHVFSHSRNRFLSIKEVLEESFECQGIVNLGRDYLMVENRPEEIRDVVSEYLDMSQDYEYSNLQKMFMAKRNVQLYKWIEDGINLYQFSKAANNVEYYRIASRIEAAGGSLGQKFLEQNWLKSSMNTYYNLD